MKEVTDFILLLVDAERLLFSHIRHNFRLVIILNVNDVKGSKTSKFFENLQIFLFFIFIMQHEKMQERIK